MRGNAVLAQKGEGSAGGRHGHEKCRIGTVKENGGIHAQGDEKFLGFGVSQADVRTFAESSFYLFLRCRADQGTNARRIENGERPHTPRLFQKPKIVGERASAGEILQERTTAAQKGIGNDKGVIGSKGIFSDSSQSFLHMR